MPATKKTKIKFSVEDLLPEHVHDFDTSAVKEDVYAMSEILARCCVELPEGWGPTHEPSTFSELDYNPEFVMVLTEMNQTIAAAKERYKDKRIHGVTFNFKGIKAPDYAEMSKRLNSGDSQKQAEVMTEIITACPPEWGNPQDAETYLRLPYYKIFWPLARQIGREGNTLKKR